MFKQIYNSFMGLNVKIKNLVKHGANFCMLIFIISGLILCTYNLFFGIPILYYIGLSLFKLSLIYFVTFFCFGFAFNKILDEM